jgi:arylsulfatase A-like enzyme
MKGSACIRLGGLGLLLPLLGCLPAPAAPQLNVVLVTFDTTRADHLGSYGGNPATSPVFDAVASRGTLFLRAQAQAAVTPVAHASIFTGLNPYHHGLRTLHGNRHYFLPDTVPTLATRLREEGYETAAFVSAFPCTERFGLEQGFTTFDADFGEAPEARVGASGNVSTGLAQRGAARTTQAALAWLADRPRDKPFFLWVHYFDPHDPLLRPPLAQQVPFMDGFPEYEAMDRALTGDMQGFVSTYAAQSDIMRPWLLRIYDAEIAWADAQMGRLLAELDGQNLMEETLVAITADHGEGLGDHGWWGHGVIYQEQVHVPLVLAGPGIPEGLQVNDRVRHVDLAPTLLHMAAGAAFPGQVDGLSLRPLLASRAAGAEPQEDDLPGPAYADAVAIMRYGAIFDMGSVEARQDQIYAWLDGDLKWIRHRLFPGQSELYDLAADPQESRNLFSSSPRDAGRLDQALDAQQPMTEELDFSPPDDEDVRRRLRSLGYID